MTNMLKGEHSFEADGVTYHMVLDANAFCEIEGALDLSLPQLLDLLKAKPGLRVFRALLFGALFEKHGFTLLECGTLIQTIGFDRITQEIMTLVHLVMPEGNADAPVGNRQARRSEAAGRAKKA